MLAHSGLCVHIHIDRDEHNDILAVTDWGQKLSFYQLSGKQVTNIFLSLWPVFFIVIFQWLLKQ